MRDTLPLIVSLLHLGVHSNGRKAVLAISAPGDFGCEWLYDRVEVDGLEIGPARAGALLRRGLGPTEFWFVGRQPFCEGA